MLTWLHLTDGASGCGGDDDTWRTLCCFVYFWSNMCVCVVMIVAQPMIINRLVVHCVYCQVHVCCLCGLYSAHLCRLYGLSAYVVYGLSSCVVCVDCPCVLSVWTVQCTPVSSVWTLCVCCLWTVKLCRLCRLTVMCVVCVDCTVHTCVVSMDCLRMLFMDCPAVSFV